MGYNEKETYIGCICIYFYITPNSGFKDKVKFLMIQVGSMTGS